MRNIRGLLLLD